MSDGGSGESQLMEEMGAWWRRWKDSDGGGGGNQMVEEVFSRDLPVLGPDSVGEHQVCPNCILEDL